MNILHIKYAVEVAKLGSVSKASEILFTAQPNISRSIRELETDLGIEIFNRSAKGMVLTPEGEEFIEYAKGILEQIDQVEKHYKEKYPKKQKLSISVPCACYISEAFAQFSKTITEDTAEIVYKETDFGKTVNDVYNNNYKLGIIRYPEQHDRYFKASLEEKELCYDMIAEFRPVVIMSEKNPLAKMDEISVKDLEQYIEISHDDPYMPPFPAARSAKEEQSAPPRRICVFERASQLDLLSENVSTYMWVSPASEKILARYGLVQKQCTDNDKIYKDVLIYKNGYSFSDIDRKFITALIESRRKYLK
ncbi:MAG: LysR family transcriptional regulator [Clostridia bacterium]|nr:LysR family transcriptional regulator [Clostridia bacterium]